MDPTDVKVALLESGRGVWNDDEDLRDGGLAAIRLHYDTRKDNFNNMDSKANIERLQCILPYPG